MGPMGYAATKSRVPVGVLVAESYPLIRRRQGYRFGPVLSEGAKVPRLSPRTGENDLLASHGGRK